MNLGLFTDLYELRMLQAYWELTHDEVAVFSLFVRRLPPKRNFLIACGLDDLLAEIEAFRFDADDLAYLATQGFPQYDIVARFSEALPGSPLLVSAMRAEYGWPPLRRSPDTRSRTIAATARLPAELRDLRQGSQAYRVEVSASLSELERDTVGRLSRA